MDKNLWIVANWKANKSLSEALDWISLVGPKLEKKDNLKVVVCPTFTALEEVKKQILVGNFPLFLGSQDLSPFPEGAYTGEEAGSILREFVNLSILGHSERRKNFGETDEMIAEKVKQAKEQGIIPLVCVQSENTPVPAGCNLVAYEPPNAISTSGPDAKADNPVETNKIALLLKAKYEERLEVLYGGSVTSKNVKYFIEKDAISGVLVGGASLDPHEFLKIIEECI